MKRFLLFILIGLTSLPQINARLFRECYPPDLLRNPFTAQLCMAPHPDGGIYIGTQTGLWYFNGLECQKEEALGEASIHLLKEFEGQLVLLTGEGEWWSLLEGAWKISEEQFDKISALCAESKESWLLLGAEGGLFRYRIGSGNPPDTLSMTGKSGTCLVKPNNRQTLIGTDSGWMIWQDGKTSPAKHSPLAHTWINTLSPSPFENFVWIGTRGQGCWRLNLKDGSCYQLKADFPDLSVNAISEEADGSLWLGTDQEGILHVLPIASDSSLKLLHQFAHANYLPAEHLLKVKGNYFFNLRGRGIGLIRNLSFFHLAPKLDGEPFRIFDGLSGADGNLWLASSRGLLRQLNGWEESRFVPAGGPEDKAIRLQAFRGKVLVAFQRQGLHLFDPDTGSWRSLFSPAEKREQGFRALETDREGGIWLQTDGGLYHLRPEEGKVEVNGIRSGLTSVGIVIPRMDQSGNLFAVGRYAIYRREQGFWKELINLKLLDSQPSAFISDQKGNYYLGTESKGLWVWKEGEVFCPDLPSKRVLDLSLTEDGKVLIWMPEGGFSYDPESRKVANLFRTNSGPAWGGRIFRDQKENYVFGYKDDIVLMDRRAGEITANGEAWVQQKNNRRPSSTQKFRMEPGGFALIPALRGYFPDAQYPLRLRLRIQPVSPSWIYLPETLEFERILKEEGSYTVEAEYLTYRGTYRAVQPLSFDLYRPVWQKPAFKISILFLCLFLASSLFYLFRVRRLRRIQEMLEEEVRERTREVEEINEKLKANLENSETMTASIILATPDLFFIVREDGVIVGSLVSPQSNQFSPFGDLTYKRIWSIVGPEERDACSQAFYAARETGELEEFEFSYSSGTKNLFFEGRIIWKESLDQSLLILRDITRRRELEIKENSLQEKLAQASLTAQEEERRRIAEELHDGVSQVLFGAQTHAHLLWRSLQKKEEFEPEHFRKLTQSLMESVSRATTLTRNLSHKIQPPDMSSLSLQEMLEDYLSQFLHHEDLRIVCHYHSENLTFSPEFKLNVLRMVQLCLTNTLKHAAASQFSLQVFEKAGRLFLSAEDDGIGFDSNAKKGQGIGLVNLRHRAKAYRGWLDIESSPGSGTSIQIEFPLG